jgi:hypothetical protein
MKGGDLGTRAAAAQAETVAASAAERALAVVRQIETLADQGAGAVADQAAGRRVRGLEIREIICKWFKSPAGQRQPTMWQISSCC